MKALVCAETCPCVSVQPACNMTAVSSATRPTKPLAAAGATCSRGERDMRPVSKCCRSAFFSSYKHTCGVFKVFRWHGQTQTRMAGLHLFSGGIAGHGGWICAYLPYFDTHASILFYMGRAMIQPVRTTPGLRPPPAPLSHRRSRTWPLGLLYKKVMVSLSLFLCWCDVQYGVCMYAEFAHNEMIWMTDNKYVNNYFHVSGAELIPV